MSGGRKNVCIGSGEDRRAGGQVGQALSLTNVGDPLTSASLVGLGIREELAEDRSKREETVMLIRNR